MTSKKIIERFQKGGWVIDVKNPREVYEVINHAEKSGLKIRYLAERVNMILTDESSNLGNACNDGLSVFYGYSNEAIKDLGMENITDWFFSEINKVDGIGREHLHNILDAWLDGDIIQSSHKNEEIWVNQLYESGLILDKDRKYRIKPNKTPLSIPNEMWAYISLNLKYAVIDKDGHIFFYEEEPVINKENNSWRVPTGTQSGAAINVLKINTYGIDWELSLTKRPEGL